jgi:hypothetical protein
VLAVRETVTLRVQWYRKGVKTTPVMRKIQGLIIYVFGKVARHFAFLPRSRCALATKLVEEWTSVPDRVERKTIKWLEGDELKDDHEYIEWSYVEEQVPQSNLRKALDNLELELRYHLVEHGHSAAEERKGLDKLGAVYGDCFMAGIVYGPPTDPKEPEDFPFHYRALNDPLHFNPDDDVEADMAKVFA